MGHNGEDERLTHDMQDTNLGARRSSKAVRSRRDLEGTGEQVVVVVWEHRG
jgi:hypothetical protein